jgi:hypothetical protein
MGRDDDAGGRHRKRFGERVDNRGAVNGQHGEFAAALGVAYSTADEYSP